MVILGGAGDDMLEARGLVKGRWSMELGKRVLHGLCLLVFSRGSF